MVVPRVRHLRIALASVAAVVSSAFAAAAATPAAEPELLLHKWSGNMNVPDPVACAVDPQGRVYVTSTTRRKAADLDIREHPMWIPNDVALDSVEAKRAFYHDVLAPGKLTRPRGMLDDHNGDGSIDWRDLTVHSERIYQLRDEDGDGTADRMTVFAEGFNTEVTGIAAGVLWHDGWVYATIAPEVWRFKDTDDDGVADIREIVATGFGFHIAYAGHDMHGLSVGPDGRIYWSIGDKGTNVTSREGRQFYYPNEGAVLRMEPDGSNFEVYAHGLRNPQEPAFNEWGDLLVVDNDADMPGERERFVHIVEASDSGWRCNYQYMGVSAPWMREGLWKPQFPGQAAYLLPPRSNYSDGPAGFRFEPGTALGPAQRGHFILTEFPSGRMRGFRVEQTGASYEMVGERDLHKGVMGIGLGWHPDGSLMMVDWIGGYPLDELGAIWRVDARERDEAARRETHDLLRQGFAERGESELLALLDHADQRVRLGAQFELAKRLRADALLGVASDRERAVLTRVHGLWGYGQLLRQGQAGAEPLRELLADPVSEIRAQAAKVLGDAPAGATANIAKHLRPLLKDNDPRVRLQAAIALGKKGTAEAVPALLAMAEQDGNDPVLRHAAVTGLVRCASPAELAAQARHASINIRLASVVALRRLRAPEVAVYLNDGDTLVVAEAARAIHDDLSIPDALPALAKLLAPTLRDEPVLRRALNANFRLGTPDAAGRLLAFALDPHAAGELRNEALTVLRLWPEPPPLDRVDGRARTLTTAPIRDVLTPKLDALLALEDPALKALGIEVMLAHALEPTPAQIGLVLRDTTAPAPLRAQAFKLLIQQHPDEPVMEKALQEALAPGSDDAIFLVAAEHLRQQRPQDFVAIVDSALTTRSTSTSQQLLAWLAELQTKEAAALLRRLAGGLVGSLPVALHLDVLEAIAPRRDADPELARAWNAYHASPAGTRRSELLAGGDPVAGRDIALNHLGANCVACHKLESRDGSEVGPSLRDVGRRLEPPAILRALLEPGAELAPGYGLVSVTLNNGDNVSGGLVRETANEVVVRRLDGGEQRVPREQIASMTPPVSMMPPMEGILDARQLRDVVAYLETLRAKR